jgi:hypothetical protein
MTECEEKQVLVKKLVIVNYTEFQTELLFLQKLWKKEVMN